jgi:hypothetical protein
MARIKDFDPSKNNSSGGYSRLFSDPDMALHHTAVHSTVIRNGNELPIKMSRHYNGNLPIFGGKEVNSIEKTKTIISKNPNGCIIIGGKIKIKNSNLLIRIILWKRGCLHASNSSVSDSSSM